MPIVEPTLHSLVKQPLKIMTPRPISAKADPKNIKLEQAEQTKKEAALLIASFKDKYQQLYTVCHDLFCALQGVMGGKKLNEQFIQLAKKRMDALKSENTLPSTPLHEEKNRYASC